MAHDRKPGTEVPAQGLDRGHAIVSGFTLPHLCRGGHGPLEGFFLRNAKEQVSLHRIDKPLILFWVMLLQRQVRGPFGECSFHLLRDLNIRLAVCLLDREVNRLEENICNGGNQDEKPDGEIWRWTSGNCLGPRQNLDWLFFRGAF